MSECNKRNEWIDKYCSGELVGEELDRFEKILEKDRKLKEEVDVERQLNTAFSNPDLVEFRNVVMKVKARKEQVVWKRRFLLAAVIIILVTSGSISWFLTSHRHISYDMAAVPVNPDDHLQNTPYKPEEKDVAPVSGKPEKNRSMTGTNEALTDRMTPYPYLEGLVGEETRSMGFTLIAPGYRAEIKKGDSLCFKWIISSSSTIKLEIVDNRGNLVKSIVTDDSPCLCYETSGHQQGLYYWKLIQSNELLCVGRFVLR